MNHLKLSVKNSDDETSELFASLQYNEFHGAGCCYLNVAAIHDAAQKFALFPLPIDGAICLEGGYYKENMRELEQTHLHISARPSGGVGRLLLRIALSTPVDQYICEFEAKLVCVVPISYEQLKGISEALIALVNGHGNEYQINL